MFEHRKQKRALTRECRQQAKELDHLFPCDQNVEDHITALHAMMQWNAEQISMCEARLSQLIATPEQFHTTALFPEKRVAQDKASTTTAIKNYSIHMTYYTAHMAKLLAYAASLDASQTLQ